MVKKNKTKNIVVIGGGTGTFTILSGLKNFENLHLSAIISMVDNGGSNRIIRDEFGLLPTSDLRQCMVALASEDSNETLRKLFTYRYENGIGISGMTFGNLFMAALTDIYKGNQKKAIDETCKILGVTGDIIPVTFDKSHLVATYANGKQILGEHEIDEPDSDQGKLRITNLQIFPKVEVNESAVNVIKSADLVVLGPGDFYTSILPNVVVEGVANAINKSKSKIVYVLNLMTKFGQTVGFKASDFIIELEKYLHQKPDVVIVNNYKKIPTEIIEKYKQENAVLVEDDLNDFNKDGKMKIIRANIVSDEFYEKSKSDKLVRSLLRHDPEKLARAVLSV